RIRRNRLQSRSAHRSTPRAASNIESSAAHSTEAGLSRHEVQSAIRLDKQHKRLKISGRHALCKQVDQDYVDDAQIVSGATQRQAIRSGELRKRLLESEGAVTYETLADMRDSNEKAARQWASRYRHAQRLFTVDAQVRVPAALVHEKPEVVEEAVNVHFDDL